MSRLRNCGDLVLQSNEEVGLSQLKLRASSLRILSTNNYEMQGPVAENMGY